MVISGGSPAAAESVSLPLILGASAAFAAVFLVYGLVTQRWIRSGAPRIRQSLAPGLLARGVNASLLFAVLPSSIACAAVAAATPTIIAFDDRPPAPLVVLVVCCAAIGACAGIWAFKEFNRPSISRAPDWLRAMLEQDAELRQIVCGNRPLPPAPHS